MERDFGFVEQSSIKFGVQMNLHLQLTVSGGTVAIDAANSDPGCAITAGATTGLVSFSCPKGQYLQYVGGGIDPGADAPVSQANIVSPRSLNAQAGTFQLIFQDAATPTVEVPANGSRVYVSLLIGRRP